jgi:hypothetical protein
VTQLLEGVMSAMWLSNVKMWAAGVLAVTVMGGATARWSLLPAAPQDRGIETEAPKNQDVRLADAIAEADAMPEPFKSIIKGLDLPKPAPGDDEMTTLLKERQRTAAREVEARFNLFQAGSARGTIDVLVDASERLCESELALITKAADRALVYERAVMRARTAEAMCKQRLDAGQIAIQDYSQVRYYRLAMEIKLLKEKHKPQEGPAGAPKDSR